MSYEAYIEVKASRCAALQDELEGRYPEGAVLTLEIGCGHGHYLTSYGEAHPEAQCLGIDLVSKRIRRALAKRDKRGLEHLHFIKADVREFFSVLPEGIRLGKIFILFPDPWPKKRHTKNRILQASLLTELARRAEPGTHLHFRTDHEGQFAYGLDLLASHPDWAVDDEIPWPHESGSFFQDMMEAYFSVSAERRLL